MPDNPEMEKYVACCREGFLSVLDPWNYHVVKKWQAHKSIVLDATYHSQLNWIVTSAADRTMCAWDSTSLTRTKLWRTPWPQTAVTYAHATQRIYSGGTDGIVRAYEVDQLKNIVCNAAVCKPHSIVCAAHGRTFTTQRLGYRYA